MNRKDNEWEDVVPGVSALTSAELDAKLEEATVLQQRSEKLICCYLNEIQERRAYKEFGYTSIYDYARVRLGFQERKTRYLVWLGRKVKELPQIREALRSGKLGWVKATRIASIARKDDESMWLDSALSLTVQELDRRIKDGTDRMASLLQFRVSEDLRLLWENALETARRVAGSEISPTQAFEYMVAEFIATWANGGAPVEGADESKQAVAAEPKHEESETETETETEMEQAERSQTVFPFVEPLLSDMDACEAELHPEIRKQLELERGGKPYDRDFRKQVLDRDQWKCGYPGCNARRELHVHHVEFRSQGGPNELWNCIALCAFHHALIHAGQIGLQGRAPHHLDWRPPKLMREVLDRKRNREALWGELEVREFPREFSEERVCTSA